MTDIVITPASGNIEFYNTTNTTVIGSIRTTSSNNIIISASGGVQYGNTLSDVFIGDGVNTINIQYQLSGAIRAVSGNTLTVGSSNSFVTIASNTVFNNRVTQSSFGFVSATKDDITTRTDSGFFQTATATTGEGWPETTNSWYHLLSSTHTNDVNYYAMQFAADFYNNKLFYRSTNGSGATGWSQVAFLASPTFSGTLSATNVTVSANLTVSSAGELVITPGAGIFANGGLGTAGQVLASNGTSIYWSTVSGGASLTANNTSTATFFIPMANTTSGSWSNGVVANTKLYFVPSSGTLSATVFNSLSDEEYKINVQTVSDALNIVNNLRGVSFIWKDNNIPSIGVIAQEVEKVLPELVNEHDNRKSVNYDGLIGVLIEAIKELKQEIDDLKNKNNK